MDKVGTSKFLKKGKGYKMSFPSCNPCLTFADSTLGFPHLDSYCQAVWNGLSECQQILIEGTADLTQRDSVHCPEGASAAGAEQRQMQIEAVASPPTRPSHLAWRPAVARQPPLPRSQSTWRRGEKVAPSSTAGDASTTVARTSRHAAFSQPPRCTRPVVQPAWRSAATSQPLRPCTEPTWRRGEKLGAADASAGSWGQRGGTESGSSAGFGVAQRQAERPVHRSTHRPMQSCCECGREFPSGSYSGSHPCCWDCR
jgi:hypothetical protein